MARIGLPVSEPVVGDLGVRGQHHGLQGGDVGGYGLDGEPEHLRPLAKGIGSRLQIGEERLFVADGRVGGEGGGEGIGTDLTRRLDREPGVGGTRGVRLFLPATEDGQREEGDEHQGGTLTASSTG